MATFNLEESLARRLRAWAARQHRSPEEILTEWVEERLSADEQSSYAEATQNPLLRMAQRAEELGLSSGRSDISERSREILNEEYPRYLKARMDRNETDTD
jgi:plasmid stability protein